MPRSLSATDRVLAAVDAAADEIVDVTPAGAGWTVGPFDGVIRDGRVYGRGACDMKAGIAAAVYAAEAIRRAGVEVAGSIEISATPDEESGGVAGAAWLAARGRIS